MTAPSDHRSCIFCGRDDGPITKEDVVPRWTRAYFPEVEDTSHEAFVILPDGAGVTQKYAYSAAAMEVTVNAVCGECNHGWMSAMEGSVMSVLGPMLRVGADRHSLSASDLRILATWALKTSIAFEFVTPENVYIPQEQRTLMAEHQGLALNTHVWMGARFDDHDLVRFRSHRMISTLAGGRVLGEVTYEATLLVHAVVWRIVGTTIREVDLTFDRPGPAMHPIWPPRGDSSGPGWPHGDTTWPPRLGFMASDVDQLFRGEAATG